MKKAFFMLIAFALAVKPVPLRDTKIEYSPEPRDFHGYTFSLLQQEPDHFFYDLDPFEEFGRK